MCVTCGADAWLEIAVLANAKSFTTVLYRCKMCGAQEERHQPMRHTFAKKSCSTTLAPAQEVPAQRPAPRAVSQDVQCNTDKDIRALARPIKWALNGPRITRRK